MKPRELIYKTILALTFLLVYTTILFASVILPPYDKSKPPGLSLSAAYDYAIVALGAKTNQLHCVSAEITTSFSSDGEWYFTFYPTNSNPVPTFIAVRFNGKVIFDNGLR